MKKTLLSMIAALSLSTLAAAQDFYNGCRGPKPIQIDTYADYSNGEATGKIIPKIFTEDLLVAVPFSVSKEGVENQGTNLGFIRDLYKINTIAAIGLFKDGNGDYKVLKPQIYLTKDLERVSLDFEAALPTDLETGKISRITSLTAGLGLTDRLRVGCSVTKQDYEDSSYKGIVRFELKKDHQYWVESYFSKNSLGLRLALNF
jgi:hypothetical protein